MKKRMGRPNGHSPKDPVIRALSVTINEKKTELERVHAELRDLQTRLARYRSIVIKHRAKRVKKVSKPKKQVKKASAPKLRNPL